MMHHHIAAARFGCNETKTLLVVKPFHLPHRHLRNPFLSLRGSAATMSRKLCPFCTSSAVKLNNNDGHSAKQAESASERLFRTSAYFQSLSWVIHTSDSLGRCSPS